MHVYREDAIINAGAEYRTVKLIADSHWRVINFMIKKCYVVCLRYGIVNHDPIDL